MAATAVGAYRNRWTELGAISRRNDLSELDDVAIHPSLTHLFSTNEASSAGEPLDAQGEASIFSLCKLNGPP